MRSIVRIQYAFSTLTPNSKQGASPLAREFEYILPQCVNLTKNRILQTSRALGIDVEKTMHEMGTEAVRVYETTNSKTAVPWGKPNVRLTTLSKKNLQK